MIFDDLQLSFFQGLQAYFCDCLLQQCGEIKKKQTYLLLNQLSCFLWRPWLQDIRHPSPLIQKRIGIPLCLTENWGGGEM